MAHTADARRFFERDIETGQRQGAHLLALLADEVPLDYLVHSPSIDFHVRNDELRIGFDHVNHMSTDGVDLALHPNALAQLATDFELPVRWIYSLLEELPRDDTDPAWAQKLLAHNLRTMALCRAPKRRLLRVVDGEVRAWLSDRYRRIDAQPVFDAFAGACSRLGAVPIEATHTETQWSVKCVLPQVFEPAPQELVVYGAVLRTSDFGDGALSVRTFCRRLLSGTDAIRDEVLRKVHAGRRLSADDMQSDDAHALDCEAVSATIAELVDNLLSAHELGRMQSLVQHAVAQTVDVGKRLAFLSRSCRITSSESKGIAETFASPDNRRLPQGKTAWRLSSAISLFALGRDVAPRRRADLQVVAGSVLPRI